MATCGIPVDQFLTISDHNEVCAELESHDGVKEKWRQLGATLGLSEDTLDGIKRKRDGVSGCLSDSIAAWLGKTDGVMSNGGPTYFALIAALRKIEEHVAATRIDQEKHPWCAIFAHFGHNQVLMKSLTQLSMFLLKNRLIEAMFLPDVSLEQEALWLALQKAVCANYHSIGRLAGILQQIETTLVVGNEMMTEYEKILSREKNQKQMVVIYKEGGIDIYLKDLTPILAIRKKFDHVFYAVGTAMKDFSMKDLGNYFRLLYPHCKKQLEGCKNVNEILDLVSDNCLLTDIGPLEAAVDEFNVIAARPIIEKYKDSVDELLLLYSSVGKAFSGRAMILTTFIDQQDDASVLDDVHDLMAVCASRYLPSMTSVVVQEFKEQIKT